MSRHVFDTGLTRNQANVEKKVATSTPRATKISTTTHQSASFVRNLGSHDPNSIELFTGKGAPGDWVRVEPVTLPSALHRRLVACPNVHHILKNTNPVRFHPRVVLKICSLLRAARSIVVVGVQDALHISVRPVDCIFCDDKSQDPAFDTTARRILDSFDASQTFPVLVTATTPQLLCLFL